MSDWKVSLEIIEVFDHPNAEKLDVCKVGTYPLVCQKGLYKTGDLVAFAPEKSILPTGIKEKFETYLTGAGKDRVRGIRLRGEPSMGIVLPLDLVKEKVGFTPEIGVDISKELSIIKYEAPIPVALMGQVKRSVVFDLANEVCGKHDCEHFRVYGKEFVPGERVVVGEKLHGSQIIITLTSEGTKITSKGICKQGLYLEESEANSYWQAYHNTKIKALVFDPMREAGVTGYIRIFGELIPCQTGYRYGQNIPIVKIFDIRVDGISIPYDQVVQGAKDNWVPILYDGPYDESVILPLCEGKECVSGLSLHIREGCVLAPYIDRRAGDRTRLRVKIINPKYKETGEEIN